ncbi:hypothetical protein ID866_12220 [Astraeus odoratus]|nr:hypothetical protein ID866_12220 [Astraeus odoratus]
MISTQQYIV